ncbi:hypothetical protein [Acidianus sp. HS-5]|uniref:hypothetical protein n=1 Tax=Acidianus sp. HS-5 TaxID=2886040 RepID=UPI001F1FBCFB|nr:hypothetical protein [Acidianus sp. HS-5]BDC17198.1 hypothetical protein HS5_00880 [Acidianus sp. HS-5]
MDEVAFLASFLPCSFEGFEMSLFSYIASSNNKKMGNLGTIVGVLIVLSLIYLTYVFLPVLITDTSEYIMRMSLGFLLIGMATLFLFKDYPEPRGAFLTASLGITAEGIEVNIFTVSSWIMTGDYVWALIGGILGFAWSLITFRLISVKFPKGIMKNIAVGLLYTIGFVILTSGLI